MSERDNSRASGASGQEQPRGIGSFQGGYSRPYRAARETEWTDSPQGGPESRREVIPKGAIALFDREPGSAGAGDRDWQEAMYEGQLRYIHPSAFEADARTA